MPWYQVYYQHPNGTLTEFGARETASAEQAIFAEKLGLLPHEEDDENGPASALEIEARYFAFRKRMEWDGDLIAVEISPPPPSHRRWTPRVITARSSLEPEN